MPRRFDRLLLLLVPLLAGLGPRPLRAEPLSLEAAVDRALQRHPAVLAASEATSAAREQVGTAESSLWPHLSLVGAYRYSQPVGELTIDTGIVPPGATAPLTISRELGTPHNASIGLQAGWRAFDWGARQALVEASEASVRAAQADEASRQVDIAFAVREAYLASVFFASVDDLTARSLETAQREEADRQARLRSGLGSEVDVASASARVAELQARQVNVRAQRGLAEDTLRLLLGMGDGEPLELADDLDAVEAGAAAVEGAQAPSVQRFQAQIEALERQGEATRRSFWPTVDLFSSVAYQFPRTFVETDQAGFAYAVGVTLTWELFDGYSRRHREDALASQERAADQAMAADQEDLTRSRLDAASRRDAAAASLDAAGRQLEAAETYLRAAQAAYRAGSGTALDVLTAEGSVDAAHLAELQARFDRAAATADLLRAAGVAALTATGADSAPEPDGEPNGTPAPPAQGDTE